ncbi:DUF3027 domain-containing protein [Actinophytocola sp. NPDC049390]|uniref:DUF3027 domain-containing protein n=1 Tax=Actinophytocola sp. NPDC049390 TaxID=3363894 RepID=UPI003788C186
MQQSDLIDPALVAEVDLARAAAQEEAGDERVGDYVEYQIEDSAAVTHLFEAGKPGYHGWRWAVTITSAGPTSDVTVSEVVLLPGPTALVAPEWIPWQQRVQAGDLGVGDLLPTSPDDPRLVPAYVASDDPAVEEVAAEAGLGRVRVMSRPARLDAADRWLQSDFGPRSDMARSAPAHCGTCGFYLPLAGSMRAAFGTCGNEFSPADGHVVHAEYGCGAHSEAEVEQVSPVLVADLIYDDAQLDVEPLAVVDEVPSSDAVLEAVDASTVTPEGAADESDSGVSGGAVGAAEVVSAEPDDVRAGDTAAGSDSVAGDASGERESGGSAAVPVEPVVAAVAPVVDESGAEEASGEPEAAPVVDESAGAVSDSAAGDALGESESGGSAAVLEEPEAPAIASVADESAGAVSDSAAGDASGELESGGSAAVPVEPVEPDVAPVADESGAEEASGEPEPGPVVDESGAPSPTVDESGVTAEALADEVPVVGSAAVEDAAPAAIEPVVTDETAGNDESASRE